MELHRFLALGRRWLWLIALSAGLTSLATLWFDLRRVPLYEAQAQLLIGPALSSSDVGPDDLRVSSQLVQVYADLAVTRPILEGVIEGLDLPYTPDGLKARVKVTPLTETQLIKIRVEDPSPNRAALIANTLAEALVQNSPSQTNTEGAQLYKNLQDEIVRLSLHISGLETSIAELEAEQSNPAQSSRADTAGTPDPAQMTGDSQLTGELVNLRAQLATAYQALGDLYARLRQPGKDPNQIRVIEPAIPDPKPVSPQVPLDVALGAMVGLVVSAAAALSFEFVNDTIESVDDLARFTGVTVIGTLAQRRARPGQEPALPTLSLSDSMAAERYGVLRTNLQFFGLDQPSKCLMVTSPEASEGKSEVAANLAVTFAQTGLRVMLVDVDLWQPRVAQLFAIPEYPGLAEALVNPNTPPAFAQIPSPPWAQSLQVLPSGLLPSYPSAMLTSQRWQTLLQGLTGEADLVILDAPPVLARPGALVLAKQADALLMVVNAGRTSRQALKRAIENFQLAGAGAIAAVLNSPDAEFADRDRRSDSVLTLARRFFRGLSRARRSFRRGKSQSENESQPAYNVS